MRGPMTERSRRSEKSGKSVKSDKSGGRSEKSRSKSVKRNQKKKDAIARAAKYDNKLKKQEEEGIAKAMKTH